MKKSIQLQNLIIKCYLIILVMGTQISVTAQKMNDSSSIQLKNRIYKASIITFGSKKTYFGYLANLSDSNLYLSQSPLRFGSVKPNDHFSDYSYGHLEKVGIQRKGSAGRGALYGALTGLFLGAITGAAGSGGGSNFEVVTPGQAIAGGGIIGAAAGALIGAIIGGLAHEKFIIGGNKQKFDSMRESILRKLMKSNNYSTQYTPQPPQL